jgi:hypothetical protein
MCRLFVTPAASPTRAAGGRSRLYAHHHGWLDATVTAQLRTARLVAVICASTCGYPETV